MDIERFAKGQREHLVRIASDPEAWAWSPPPLPTEVELTTDTWSAVAAATYRLGQVRELSALVPGSALFRAPLIRREAHATSALEGTHAPFGEVMEADVASDESTLSPEVREIRNYVEVADLALDWVIAGRPITLGLLSDLQARLVVGTPGGRIDLGRIRTGQVVIGARGAPLTTARYVPPPPGPSLEASVSDWLGWSNKPTSLAPVVAAALAHYQFEALHPFNDGNGRLGRLLIVLHLIQADVINDGLLAVSPWFEANRREYQDELLAVSHSGDFDNWVAFFAAGVEASATDTSSRARSLLALGESMRETASDQRWRGAIIEVIDQLTSKPVLTAAALARDQGISTQAAYGIIDKLLDTEILTELTGRSYGRVFACSAVLDVLGG